MRAYLYPSFLFLCLMFLCSNPTFLCMYKILFQGFWYTHRLTFHNIENNNHSMIHDQDLEEKIISLPFVSENIKTVWLYERPMYKLFNLIPIPYLKHSWVVLETDGHHFWSMEKNSIGVDVQVATKLWKVKDQLNGEDRPNGKREVISGEGRGQVSDLLLAINRQNLLGRPYHLLWDNCKYFASDIIKDATKEGIDCTIGFFGLLSHPMTVNVGPEFNIEQVGADTVHYYGREARRVIADLSHPDTQVYMIGYITAVVTLTSDAVVILTKKGSEHTTWIIETNGLDYHIKFDKGHTALQGLDQSKKYRLDNIAIGKTKFSEFFKLFDTVVTWGAGWTMKPALDYFFDKICSDAAHKTLETDERENAIRVHCPAGVAQSMVRPFEQGLEKIRSISQAITHTSLKIASKIFQQQTYITFQQAF